MRKFSEETEIVEIVSNFENGSISRENWKHAEHLTVALYYLWHNDFDIAYTKMRNGIFNLLAAFNVDLLKEMPYHETLTVFWMKTVDDFRKSKTGSSIVEIGNELIEKFDKDFPLRFYTNELLFSDEARAKFIEGDIKNAV